MAGRKPKPTALRVLEGNPSKRPLPENEPKPPEDLPTCPRWLLPEAKREWKRLARVMNDMGVLTLVDRAAFATYCQSWARYREAQEHITQDGPYVLSADGSQKNSPWLTVSREASTTMMRAAAEFGLTPSSRTKIIGGKTEAAAPRDAMEALLG